jgi:ribosomal protein S18 acetylase RimI-like enzyme
LTEDYKIVYDDKPADGNWGIIGRGVSTFNQQQVGDENYERLCLVLKGSDQEVVGGLAGSTFYDWLVIDLLWIKEELRGRGYGKRLMERAEEEAKQRGATNALLDTLSFQAPDFYKKLGYQVFGELKDFPPGHQRLYFTKQL